MTNVTDFELLAFFVADHAAVSEGKLYVNGGGWDKITFPSYPQAFPISIAGQLLVPYRAYQQDHIFVIGLEDSDRNPLEYRVEGRFRVGAEPDLRVGDPTRMPFAVPGNTAAIPGPGDYAFTFSVDGHELARLGIRAVQVPFITSPGVGGAPLGPDDAGDGSD